VGESTSSFSLGQERVEEERGGEEGVGEEGEGEEEEEEEGEGRLGAGFFLLFIFGKKAPMVLRGGGREGATSSQSESVAYFSS